MALSTIGLQAPLQALTGNFDKVLAIGVGVVLTDLLGDRVKGWINSVWAGAGVWADPLAEILIGVGILFLGEWFAPVAWKVLSRLAAFGAMAAGVADIVSHYFGASPSIGGSPTEGGQGSEGGLEVSFI